MRNYRLHWDAELGWIVDTDVALSIDQLRRICDWAVPRQVARWRGLPIGEKKTELEAAIKCLQFYQINQRVIFDDSGISTLFKSNHSTGKIISCGGI